MLLASLSVFVLVNIPIALLGDAAYAQTLSPLSQQSYVLQHTFSSSNVADSGLPEAPEPSGAHTSSRRAVAGAEQSIRPFSRVGMAVTGGTGGIGIEVATPLSDHFNLRARGSYFSYYLDFSTEGYNVTGRVLARSVNTSLDIFPFHNGFRISPGVTLDNGNAVHGNIVIPAGQSFDLGDGTYTSAAGDPVRGAVALTLGHKVAPSLTVGWGNLIQRRPGRFSFPVEIGVEYIGAPLVDFNLQGSVCDQNNDCGTIAGDPTTVANVQAQKTKINNDIYPLRFFPIFSVGFGWTF
jgi:hypothetical protein